MTGEQVDITISYNGRPTRISARLRCSGDDTVVLLHGLGCSKESFDGAFWSRHLRGLSLCAFDFPGYGHSERWTTGDYSLEAYAGITKLLIDWLRVEQGIGRGRLSLVGHSMGGAVAVLAAGEIPSLTHLVSVEGNLIGEDCGLVSRRIAEQSSDAFPSTGHRDFRRELETSSGRDLRAWASWYAMADARAVHQSARSLVEWSDSEKLLELLDGLTSSRTYIYGANDAKAHLLPRLRNCDIRRVGRAGHFLMVDRPHAFYKVLAASLPARGRNPGQRSMRLTWQGVWRLLDAAGDVPVAEHAATADRLPAREGGFQGTRRDAMPEGTRRAARRSSRCRPRGG